MSGRPKQPARAPDNLELPELPELGGDENARLDAMAEEDIANGVGVPLDEAIAWVES